MKNYTILFILLFAVSCKSSITESALVARMDSLSNRIEKLEHSKFKPGLGEFMSGIQTHHAKLWFAGMSENWKLANFELDEIRETLDYIKLYNTDRSEIKNLPLLVPALDSIDFAIKSKNLISFKTCFLELTSACNKCHRQSNFEFNNITIPTAPPVNNQDFRVRDANQQ